MICLQFRQQVNLQKFPSVLDEEAKARLDKCLRKVEKDYLSFRTRNTQVGGSVRRGGVSSGTSITSAAAHIPPCFFEFYLLPLCAQFINDVLDYLMEWKLGKTGNFRLSQIFHTATTLLMIHYLFTPSDRHCAFL